MEINQGQSLAEHGISTQLEVHFLLTHAKSIASPAFVLQNDERQFDTTLGRNVMTMEGVSTSYFIISFKPGATFEVGDTTKAVNAGTLNLAADRL